MYLPYKVSTKGQSDLESLAKLQRQLKIERKWKQYLNMTNNF